jgi:hypothetical protein
MLAQPRRLGIVGVTRLEAVAFLFRVLIALSAEMRCGIHTRTFVALVAVRDAARIHGRMAARLK